MSWVAIVSVEAGNIGRAVRDGIPHSRKDKKETESLNSQKFVAKAKLILHVWKKLRNIYTIATYNFCNCL